MGKWFFKTILFKEADKRLLCRFGSKMCNEKLKRDHCLIYEIKLSKKKYK